MKQRRTIDPEGKRRRILDAAWALFSAQGFDATAVADVAIAADVAVGTVHRHFATKRALYVTVSQDLEQVFLQAIVDAEVQALPVEARFGPMMQALFGVAEAHVQNLSLLSIPHAVRGHATRKAIETMVEEGIEKGHFRTVDPPVVTALAYGMVEGALQACFATPGAADPERYVAALEDALSAWVMDRPSTG